MKRIIAVIVAITLVMGNNVSVLASEIGDAEQVISEEGDLYTEEYSKLNSKRAGKVCIASLEPTEWAMYTGNEGDSCIYNLDKKGLAGKNNDYSRNGNIGVNDKVYENGYEAWIARWNYKAEISWASITYDLGKEYKQLSGKTSLIKSYNTTNFNTTIYFYGDGELLHYQVLTDQDYQHEFKIDVRNVETFKILVKDNKAVMGGTSFALYDMFLTQKEAVSKVILDKASYNYNGKSKTPDVTVMSGSKELSKGKDYTVSYKNNKNIGKATVIVRGRGNYTGKITKTFTIKAKKGATFTYGSYKYKVTSSSTVAFIGLAKKEVERVIIPKTVKYGGKTFKVTAIADKALKGKTKVTQITVGNNVKIIGKQAFYGCKNLKTLTIKSTKLEEVGSKALKGINSKATIKVPKNKLTAYKKLLKGKGQGSKVKIVKYN